MGGGGQRGIETGEAEPGPDLIGIQQLSPSAGKHSCRRREGGVLGRAGLRCGSERVAPFNSTNQRLSSTSPFSPPAPVKVDLLLAGVAVGANFARHPER